MIVHCHHQLSSWCAHICYCMALGHYFFAEAMQKVFGSRPHTNLLGHAWETLEYRCRACNSSTVIITKATIDGLFTHVIKKIMKWQVTASHAAFKIGTWMQGLQWTTPLFVCSGLRVQDVFHALNKKCLCTREKANKRLPARIKLSANTNNL